MYTRGMPTANIYFSGQDNVEALQALIPDLKTYLAQELSCSDISLTSEEISIRFITNTGPNMIGDVEVQISAHSFPERIQKQDQVCLDVMKWLQDRTEVKNIKVWLQLSKLGHSW